nr:MAG TPA: hypothetical protein [Caudoviricetes sp.]
MQTHWLFSKARLRLSLAEASSGFPARASSL